MKKRFLFISSFVIAAVVLLASNPSFGQAQDPAQQQQQLLQIGRYQLLDATLSSPPDAPEELKTFKRLVVLDTMTGMISVCDYVYQDAGRANTNDRREYWWANGACVPFTAHQAFLVPKRSSPSSRK